tara:strand:+ start:551 stop:799 length:249 start_codon:yes stop_codon:yes gene_type:complete
MTDYAIVLTRRYAGNQWTLNGDDYTGLTWLSDTPKPTKTKLDSLWAEVQQEIADEQTAKTAQRQAILDKLGLTANEAAALFG